MQFTIGSLVTRISYNHDTVFKILKIKNQVAYLKGVQVRLYADAFLEDLQLYVEDERSLEDDLDLDLSLNEDRGDYFFLPGKVLHIDTDNQLSNKPTNPYKIRENSKFNNHKKSQKEQKISNFS